MRTNPVIAVDFDNTIVDWVDDDRCVLKKGAVDALRRLKKRGCVIIINTCRIGIAKKEGDLEEVLDHIRGILEDFDIPYDSIHMGSKLVADAYIDDRAVAFRGDWHRAADETEQLLFETK